MKSFKKRRFQPHPNTKNGFDARTAVFWVCMTALCMLKYLIYGFEYYPILDDYIQYWAYPNAQDIWNDIVLTIGLYNARPLSSLADPYVWGRFWAHMGAALFIITLLHVAGAYLIGKSLERSGFVCGPLFYIILLLLPLGFEATYWISASSRIVVGMFFVGLSLWCYTRYLDCQKKRWLWLFWVFGLVSFGFYEQVIILGFLLTVLVLWRTFKECPDKKAVLVPFINLIFAAAYYAVFSGRGAFGGRSALIAQDSLKDHFGFITYEIYLAWKHGLVTLNVNGFWRGLEILKQNIWYLLAVILVCGVAAACIGRREKPDWKALWIAPVLFVAPYALFFALKGSIVSFRNTYTSFVGLGLVCAFLFDVLVRNIHVRRLVLFLVVFLFMAVNISEFSDYRKVSLTDRAILEKVTAALDGDVLAGRREAVLVGAKWHYTEQNAYHREHIYSITQSDWALTGGAHCIAGTMKIKKITPTENLTPELKQSGAQILYIDENLNVSRAEE